MTKLKYLILGSIIPILLIFINLTLACTVTSEFDQEFDCKLLDKGFMYQSPVPPLQSSSVDPHFIYSRKQHLLNELKVIVTMYYPVYAQTDSTPNQLADGTKIDISKASEYRYVALSRDLLSRWGGPYDYGDIILLEDVGKYSGLYKVKDTMNNKFRNRVDILLTEGTPHFIFYEGRLSKWKGN